MGNALLDNGLPGHLAWRRTVYQAGEGGRESERETKRERERERDRVNEWSPQHGRVPETQSRTRIK